MRTRTASETAIICATGLIALAVVIFGLHLAHANGKSVTLLLATLVVGACVIAWSRYRTTGKDAQACLTGGEQSGGEQYRQLAEEYRRLADLAITAQEHTDLKLGGKRATRLPA